MAVVGLSAVDWVEAEAGDFAFTVWHVGEGAATAEKVLRVVDPAGDQRVLCS